MKITDETTLQEACDYAVLKIVEQGGQCVDEFDSCVYSKEGKHCAIGWLIDCTNTELASFGGSVNGMIDDFSGLLPKVVRDNLSILCVLQRFHDHRLKLRRVHHLERLSQLIDVSAPQYQQWVEMGDNK